jgi:hypothetical protein
MLCLNRLFVDENCNQESRRFLRFSLSLNAECHFNSGDMAAPCRLVDVCRQGMGFEIETDVSMRYGQNVLLKIFIPAKHLPASAIVKLKWRKIPHEAAMIQRVGGLLMFMDVREKAHLLQHAYAEALGCVSGADFASQPSRAFNPRLVF